MIDVLNPPREIKTLGMANALLSYCTDAFGDYDPDYYYQHLDKIYTAVADIATAELVRQGLNRDKFCAVFRECRFPQTPVYFAGIFKFLGTLLELNPRIYKILPPQGTDCLVPLTDTLRNTIRSNEHYITVLSQPVDRAGRVDDFIADPFRSTFGTYLGSRQEKDRPKLGNYLYSIFRQTGKFRAIQQTEEFGEPAFIQQVNTLAVNSSGV